MSLVLFVVGLVALIKGPFRLLNRSVSKRDGRLVGLVLILPFLLEIVIVFSLSFSMVSQAMVVADDGTVSLSAQVFDDYVNQVMAYEPLLLISAAIAVGAAIAIILRSPQTGRAWSAPTTPAPAPHAHPLNGPGGTIPTMPTRAAAAVPLPAVMTVPEAAAYLRVTPAEIDQMIDQGRLPAARSPGGYRIARSLLDEMLAAKNQ